MNQSLMGLNQRSLVLSVVIAGVAIGLLSRIPLIACVNCLLMAWVWGGAIGAVALYRRYERQPYLSTTQGLVIGAAAGIVGGIAALLFSGMNAAIMQALSSYANESGVSIPDFILGAGFSLFGILLDVVVYGVVGAIGGLIATALIWKAPAAIPPPPPYSPPTGPGM
jgi:hypothetical protein